MAKTTYTKAQREKAKAEGKFLCAVDTPGFSFGGPCTGQELNEFTAFIDGFLKRRGERLKAEKGALPAEQEVKPDA